MCSRVLRPVIEDYGENKLLVEFGPYKHPTIRGHHCLVIDWHEGSLQDAVERLQVELPATASVTAWCLDLIKMKSRDWNSQIALVKGTASVVAIRYFSWAFSNELEEHNRFQENVRTVYIVLRRAWDLLQLNGFIEISPSFTHEYHKLIATTMGFEVTTLSRDCYRCKKINEHPIPAFHNIKSVCDAQYKMNVSEKIRQLRALYRTL